jgi:hypothetical protein
MIIPFELWRSNYPADHYDHHTIVIVSLFTLAIANVRRRFDCRAIVLLGAVSSLYLLQASTAVAAIPSALAVLCASLPATAWRRQVRAPLALGVSILLMLGSIAFLTIRARVSTGRFELSTRQGPALLMFVQAAYRDDDAQVRRLAESAGVPRWYLWCFDHAQSPVPAEHPSAPTWSHLSKAFGTCMRFTGEPTIPGQPWPFDYSELIRYLTSESDTALLKLAEADDYDTRERQFVFYGVSPELSPRWISAYGAQSRRVAIRLLTSDPIRYVRTAWRQHRYLFVDGGSLFFASVGDDRRTQDYPARMLISRFNVLVGRSMWLIFYWTVPITLLLLPIHWVRHRLAHAAENPLSFEIRAWDYAVLGAPVCVLAAVFSGTVALENNRYFVQITPLLLVIGSLAISDSLRILRHELTVALWTRTE